jgi:hypothetical protein
MARVDEPQKPDQTCIRSREQNFPVTLGGCLQMQKALLAGFTSVNVFDMHAENSC